MAVRGRVRTAGGALIPVKADTICVHGDGAKALEFARRIKEALQEEGIEVTSCP